MSNTFKIKLYGAQRCHKTKFYQSYLEQKKLNYTFLDVEIDKDSAIELRSLYKSGKLNFPTVMIGKKVLRNPTDKELTKWLSKQKSH